MRWSSASRTRIAISSLQGNGNVHSRAAAGGRRDLQASAEGIEPLPDAHEAESRAPPVRQGGRRVEADAVVRNRAANRPRLALDLDLHVRGMCVPNGVAQRLVRDPAEHLLP